MSSKLKDCEDELGDYLPRVRARTLRFNSVFGSKVTVSRNTIHIDRCTRLFYEMAYYTVCHDLKQNTLQKNVRTIYFPKLCSNTNRVINPVPEYFFRSPL